MNGRRLEARVSELAFPGIFKRYFPPRMPCCFVRIYCKTAGNNVVKISQTFHDIAWFERFTDLNLFKYAFNVIQNWETYLSAVIVEGDESNRLRMAN